MKRFFALAFLGLTLFVGCEGGGAGDVNPPANPPVDDTAAPSPEQNPPPAE
ncbi:MAG TPA: hypothetical protein VFT74_07505 [Isosphaeraceae bacterium]|nr:hypothetical protein [Isosphaeraceae bacterium]